LDKVAPVKPDDLEKEALAAAAEARSLAALSEVRVRYLGRQSVLKLALREVRDRETGMTLNAVRETVESALSAREAELARAELEERLATERVDVTLPARLLGPPQLRPRGTLHPSTLVRRDVEDIFLGLGYEIVDGREVETTRYNFDALGFPDWHPSRSPRDSLFLDEQTLLRTETSPAQIHKMEALPDLPPVRGTRHRQGDHARRPQRDAAARDASAVRARARHAVPHPLLPLHRALDGR
jgi:phenylalanyl-tRNA synthetase alpha chain